MDRQAEAEQQPAGLQDERAAEAETREGDGEGAGLEYGLSTVDWETDTERQSRRLEVT